MAVVHVALELFLVSADPLAGRWVQAPTFRRSSQSEVQYRRSVHCGVPLHGGLRGSFGIGVWIAPQSFLGLE